MRVLFVNPGLDLGGAEHSLLLLLPALRSRGIDVNVVLFGEGPFQQRLHAEGFTTKVLPLSRSLRRGTRYRTAHIQTAAMLAAGVPAALRLASIIRRDRIDIVHTNGAKAHLIGGLAGRLARCRVIWHVRDFPLTDTAGRLFAYALRRFPHMIIANSAAIARSVRALGAAAERVVVAVNPVNLDLLAQAASREDARATLGLPVGAPIAGLIAHLTPWKGHERFLQIARRVRDAMPNARFVVAGGSIYETDGHDFYLDRLRTLTEELNLTDCVTFLGNCSDVGVVLSALDVLVHCPTAPEPFGRVLAEAMAAGRPVVATRCGGIPEVVIDGETGILVDDGDVNEFTKQIVRLFERQDVAEALGSAGRRHAVGHFTVDMHLSRVLRAYEHAV